MYREADFSITDGFFSKSILTDYNIIEKSAPTPNADL
jgi:hypothetical protein